MRSRAILAAACALVLAPAATATAAPATFPVPAQLKLLNYYPANDGWSYMWERWNPRAIDADLARVAGLRANAVRVIVQAKTFGYPAPRAKYQARLAQVIDLAAAHGLRVELTLFDWWHDYADVAGSERWASTLLAPYAGDPRVAAIELQNELDPADPAATAWAAALLPFLRTIDGGIPLTISVAATDPVGRLQLLKQRLGASLPDFWSVHFYDRPEVAYSELAAAQAVAAPQPLFVGETGYSPSESVPRVRSRVDAEDEQVRFLRTLGAAAAALGLPAPAPWTLSDFSPLAIPNRTPTAEYHFGLFRVDGSPKPAATAVRAIFAGSAPTGFDEGFEGVEPGTTPAQPALWRRSGRAAFARDATVSRSGAASASVGAAGGTPTSNAYLSTATPTPWVASGWSTTLSVWARGNRATGATTASLVYFALDGRILGRFDSAPLEQGTTGWRLLTVQATAPPGAVYVRLALRSDRNAGRVWFDDAAVATV